MPGPSMSAYIIEKSSSLTLTLIPSGGVSSRFFNSLASCLITFGGRFSFVAYNRQKKYESVRGKKNKENMILVLKLYMIHHKGKFSSPFIYRVLQSLTS